MKVLFRFQLLKNQSNTRHLLWWTVTSLKKLFTMCVTCVQLITFQVSLQGDQLTWLVLSTTFWYINQLLGVANGKIRDSPRRRDPCLKIRDRDLKVLTKSEPETLTEENRARDFILRKSEPVSKTVRSET